MLTQSLQQKIDEFCFKHKKCVICDLNVNKDSLQYFVDLQKLFADSGKPKIFGM